MVHQRLLATATLLAVFAVPSPVGAKGGDGPFLKRDLAVDRDTLELRSSVHVDLRKGGTATNKKPPDVFPLSLALAAAYSFLDDLEVGVGVALAIVNAVDGRLDAARLLMGTARDDRGANRGFSDQPPLIYAVYQIVSLGDDLAKVGARIDLRLPSGRANDVEGRAKVGFGCAIPTRWKFSDQLGLDFSVGFAFRLDEGAAKKYFTVGLAPTIQATDELYFRVIAEVGFESTSGGTTSGFLDGDHLHVPLGLQVGVQVSRAVDWFLNWTFGNLKATAGATAIDERSVWTGISWRLGI